MRLLNAIIGGSFSCIRGQFINPHRIALRAAGVEVKTNVFLRSTLAKGEVLLIGATIGGSLECDEGQFINPGGHALTADGMNLKGSVFLRGDFKAEGEVRLVGATVGGYLILTDIVQPDLMTLDLESAMIGTLWDEEKSWPLKDRLHLSGLVYDTTHQEAPPDSKRRLRWLRLQPKSPFSPQPYEQLARVLRASGHEPAAKRVLIGKQRDHRRRGELSIGGRIWNVTVDALIAHGYRPHQALLYVVFFVILGGGFFGAGHPHLFSATQETTPAFDAFIYSLDVFVPIVDLHQERYWLPDANRGDLAAVPLMDWPRWGYWLRIYLWLHISLGWILTSLWVAGLTGLVRKD